MNKNTPKLPYNDQAIIAAICDTTHVISPAGVSTNDTYSDAAINTELDSLFGEVDVRLDGVETKIDEVLTTLKAEGVLKAK
ncbi:MAG: hypothetical protein ACSLE0_23465 [Chitinophagaceae bacterium]